jgi:hypothetical protein
MTKWKKLRNHFEYYKIDVEKEFMRMTKNTYRSK